MCLGIMMSRRYDAQIARTRTTFTIDDAVLRAVKLRAVATGKDESQIIEEALRRDLGLDALDEIWEAIEATPEKDAMALAREAQTRARRTKR